MNFLTRQSFAVLFSLAFISNHSAIAQKDNLKKKIETISKEAKGIVGVGIMNLKNRETIVLNDKHKFPMQSVFKFPLGMAVLDQVDKGKLTLDQKIHVTNEELNPDTWSPLQKKFPEGNIDVTIEELLSYTVSNSDNNACDILFKLVGGPEKVQEYVRGLGIKEMNIVATEAGMAKGWEVQYTNWCRPSAMLKLLDVFYQGKNLSKTSSDFLWKIMTETTTGPDKIKGLLPKDTKVAHKTGASGTNDKGIMAATNDVGILTLPNGEQIAIVVYVSETPVDEKTRDGVIAQIAKATWDYYLKM